MASGRTIMWLFLVILLSLQFPGCDSGGTASQDDPSPSSPLTDCQPVGTPGCLQACVVSVAGKCTDSFYQVKTQKFDCGVCPPPIYSWRYQCPQVCGRCS
jgi:hypothetical protein